MITKNPVMDNTCINNCIMTISARVAFKYILKAIGFKSNELILLPSYIGITDREGSGVFDPISSLEIKYDFYKLRKNLSIDMTDFQRKIKRKNVRAILIIHYFGFYQCDLSLIKTICHENNILFIEDCAHAYTSFFKKIQLGTYGDFSFFSVHKFLPTKDGGVLKINNANYNIGTISISDKMEYSTLDLLCRANIKDISKIRRKNYSYFSKKIEKIDWIQPFYKVLPNDVVPMNFPILINNGKREHVYFRLMQNNIPTIALYYRLIEQIDPLLFKDMYEISNSILNIPIHQDITYYDLDLIAKELEREQLPNFKKHLYERRKK